MKNCAQKFLIIYIFFYKYLINVNYYIFKIDKLAIRSKNQALTFLEIKIEEYHRNCHSSSIIQFIKNENCAKTFNFTQKDQRSLRGTGWFKRRDGARRRGGKYEEAFARALKSFRNSLNAERGLFQDGGFGQRTKFSKRGRNRRPKHDETP